MTPENDIRKALLTVCDAVGHWPYTQSAGVFIGFRPAGDQIEWARSMPIAAKVGYDIVIYHRLGSAEDAETMRFRVYEVLHAAGWILDGEPGPESYIENAELFAWPLAARKRFYWRNGRLITPDELREERIGSA